MKDKKYLLDMITCLIDVAANELVPFSINDIIKIENGTIIKPIYERDLSHHALNHIFPFKQLINVGYREKHPCYNMENILDDFYNKIKSFIKDQKVTILDENVDLKDSGDIFIEIIGDIILDSSEIKYLKNFLIDGFLEASMGYYNFINSKKITEMELSRGEKAILFEIWNSEFDTKLMTCLKMYPVVLRGTIGTVNIKKIK